jgi:hypothetical protein
MAYLARDLINQAWYLTGIVSRDLQTVEGSQGSDGLNFLNIILSDKSMTGRDIPFYTHPTISCVPGQEIYTIPDLIRLDDLTFNIDTVRFSLKRDYRRRYWDIPRVNTIQSLPVHYYVERVLGGSNIYLYFLPNQAYPLNMTGQFSFPSVTFDTDMLTLVDQFYINYLIYALARRLCEFYNLTFLPQAQEQLDKYEAELKDINVLDFSMAKMSTLQGRAAYGWGWVNLGRGWMP